jgi:hypothetical protein
MLERLLPCVGGKTRGAVRACLELFGSTFCIKAKGGKATIKEKNEKVTTLTKAMLRQAQHDKAQDASAITIMQTKNVEASMAF